MFAYPLIALALAAALPAAAAASDFGLTHRIEGRFGVVFDRDGQTGERRADPVGGLRYTMEWRHRSDGGWTIHASVGIEASNLPRHRPWDWPDQRRR